MGTADALVAVFDQWVAEGVHEVPAHSNCCVISHEFGFCAAWCCMSCSIALKRTGTPGFWTAAVSQAIANAKAGKNGLTWVPREGVIRRGDFSTFDWHGNGNPSDFHISCVRDPGTQTKFQTDGGNEGDAARQQWRDRTYVQGFIRPPYDGTAPMPTPIPDFRGDTVQKLVTPYPPEQGAWITDGQTKRWIEAAEDLQHTANLGLTEKDAAGVAVVHRCPNEWLRRIPNAPGSKVPEGW